MQGIDPAVHLAKDKQLRRLSLEASQALSAQVYVLDDSALITAACFAHSQTHDIGLLHNLAIQSYLFWYTGYAQSVLPALAAESATLSHTTAAASVFPNHHREATATAVATRTANGAATTATGAAAVRAAATGKKATAADTTAAAARVAESTARPHIGWPESVKPTQRNGS